MAAIKIGVDIEKMRLEPRLGGADGRAQADIGDAGNRAPGEGVVRAVAGDPHRVNPEGRAQIFAKPEIDGRETDSAAAPVADHDAAVDLPEAAELGRRLA